MDRLEIRVEDGRIRLPHPTPAPEPTEPVTRARSDLRYCLGCQYPAALDDLGYCSWCRDPATGPPEIRAKINRLRNGHEFAHRSGIIDDGGIHYAAPSGVINIR